MQTAPVTIHTYASPGPGSVNTHWIESDDGVVVIDGQRQISQAQRALRRVTAAGKPIVAIVVTHGHPDHVGGLGVFADAAGPDVPVFASAETQRTVRHDPLGFLALARRVLGADFPDPVTLPRYRAIGDGEVLSVGGIRLRAQEIGPGEAPSTTVLRLVGGDALFSGDLVANRFTPLLLEERSGAWVGQLEGALAAFPAVRTAYPGHGEPAPWEGLVADQLEYLQAFRAIVAQGVGPGASLSDTARAALVAETERRYAGYLPVVELPDLVGLNADAVARELAGSEPNRGTRP